MDRQTVIRKLLEDRVALMAYINTIVHDRHHAEDVFQDLSVEAVEKAETIRDDEHLTRWLRTAARFRAIDHLRKASTRAMVFDHDLFDKLDLIWETRAGRPVGPRVDALRDCLDSTPDKTQKLLRLRYQKGLSGKELADKTGRSTNAIYLTLSRVHKALRNCIEARLKRTGPATEGGEAQ